MKHTGVLHYCDLVQSCPPHLRRKGEKRVRERERREVVWWSMCVVWSGVVQCGVVWIVMEKSVE
jgi:hypothetical protein